ncbi:MAG: glycosyltransferase family 4 protein [Muribaculaceae bacterium]|nr:glycosyltransferase family 4 protein [Muribaculaceae bacterium]
MREYSRAIDPFRNGSVNSCKGKAQGLINLFLSMVKLLGYRLRGGRLLHIHYAGRGSWKRENMLASYGRLLGYKTLMHCHCNISELADHQGLEEVRGKLKKADANIVLAQSYKEFSERELGLDKVSVVANFVSTAEVPAGKADSKAAPVFLYLGLLSEAKGFYDLIESCARLARGGVQFKLIAGGAGDMDKVRELISKNGLEDYIELPGWIRGPEKEKAFRRADVLVLPSYSEGMPMVVIEALQHGLAVIGTEVGAVPDMVEDPKNGIIVQPGDVDALTAAMKQLAEDKPALAAFSKSAREKGLDYTAAEVLPILSEIYDKVLDCQKK